MIAAGTMAAAFDHDAQAARTKLTLWAAADTTILSRLVDTSVAVDRCILVPVYVENEIMALVPALKVSDFEENVLPAAQ